MNLANDDPSLRKKLLEEKKLTPSAKARTHF